MRYHEDLYSYRLICLNRCVWAPTHRLIRAEHLSLETEIFQAIRDILSFIILTHNHTVWYGRIKMDMLYKNYLLYIIVPYIRDTPTKHGWSKLTVTLKFNDSIFLAFWVKSREYWFISGRPRPMLCNVGIIDWIIWTCQHQKLTKWQCQKPIVWQSQGCVPKVQPDAIEYRNALATPIAAMPFDFPFSKILHN